ncbi:MAG: FadR family transcriptional regulator [Comamonas sp.]|nr:FadR family transcriptional regulator [Candidatus Comamonas equi]
MMNKQGLHVKQALVVGQGAMRHQQVVEAIGQLAVGGGFGSEGQLPSEEELCTRFEVSRTAIREAIKVLGAKGLLEARPRAGTKVRPLAHWSLFDADVLRWLAGAGMAQHIAPHLTEMREIIEPAAAGVAARQAMPEQLAVIAQAFQDMEAATCIEEWVKADLHFHQTILQATNNPFLIALGGMVGSALEALLAVNAQQARAFNEALPGHRKVWRAIAARDAEAASLWMRVLLADTRALLSLE